MPDDVINPYAGEALYVQLEGIARRMIDDGRLWHLDPVPSESSLVQAYGVSRDTVRRAVALLRDEGVVFTVPLRGTLRVPKSHPPRWEKLFGSGGRMRWLLSRSPARCGMMVGCAAPNGLSGFDDVFALLRLLPVKDRDKDVEILALRHQIAVLERQLGKARPRFSPSDRAFMAALLHHLPRQVLGRFRLIVRPETVLRCRDLPARPRGQITSEEPGPAAHRPLHPPAGAAPGAGESLLGPWRIQGELAQLGHAIAASTVWEILHAAGIGSAPRRAGPTWRQFLTAQAHAIIACDFLVVETVLLQRLYVSVTWNPSEEGTVGRRPSSPARILT